MDRIELIRGDTYAWFIRLTAPGGGPLPLQDVRIRSVAKPLDSDLPDDSDALFIHTVTFNAGGGIDETTGFSLGGTDPYPPYTTYNTPADGILTESLSASDAIVLAAAYAKGRRGEPRDIARWDLQVRDAAGGVTTPLSAIIAMRRDVGRLI
jgi:hypothetical protein